MKQKHNIDLPEGICKDLTDEDFNIMIETALSFHQYKFVR